MESWQAHRDEKQLVEALERGDDVAYEQFVREHMGRLLSVARRYLTEEDARDAVQETFLSAFQAIGRFDGKARLSTWLHRIVVNHALMRLRKASTRREGSIEDLLPRFLEDGHRVDPRPAWPATAEELMLQSQVRKQVRESIGRLPDRYREVLLLRDIEGLTGAETAAQLRIRPGTAKVRLHRARQALRELIDPAIRKVVAS